MKKIVAYIWIFCIMIFIPSCSHNREGMRLKEYGEEIFAAFQNHDPEKIKSLFTENQQKNYKNFDNEIDKAFEFIEGDIEGYEAIRFGTVGESSRDGKTVRKTAYVEITGIKAGNETYSIYGNIMLVYAKDTSLEGLQRIQIKNSKYHIDRNNIRWTDEENIRFIGDVVDDF